MAEQMGVQSRGLAAFESVWQLLWSQPIHVLEIILIMEGSTGGFSFLCSRLATWRHW